MKTSVEIPDPLWEKAKIRAAKERKSLAEVISDALKDYLATAPLKKEETGQGKGGRQ